MVPIPNNGAAPRAKPGAMVTLLLAALAVGAGALSGGYLPEGADLAADGPGVSDEPTARGGLFRKPKGEFNLDWPFQSATSEIDAWVWMMNERKLSSMYDPILLTVGEALHNSGANVAVVSERNRDAMFQNVTAALAHGRMPLIVAVALYYASPDGGRKVLRQCSDLGAFVVLYQTEPLERNAHLAELVDLVKPNEVWDYSHRNLDWYPESARHLHRYVPPGYAKGLDFGINMTAPAEMRNTIGFLGGWQLRPKAMADLYRNVFQGNLVSRDDIWTREETIRFLTEYPVQLNTHKEENCCPSTNPVEAFRMAQIISNRACVISARSDPRDEAEWQGIVHFAEPSQMADLLVEVSRDVGGCQTRSFEKFKSRFEPVAILRRSGFLEVWQPSR